MSRGPIRLAAAGLGALGAALLLLPALETGFLADDFIVVRRCADFAEDGADLSERLCRGVSNEWSSGFQGFRPLTTGSVQIDHALNGLDARSYKRTNLLLWAAAAAMFAAAASTLLRGMSAPRTAAAAFLFAVWPPAVEPLCWMVIRQESLLCLGAFGAVGLVAVRGVGPWFASLGVAFALGSKETGATLPCALFGLDAALRRREGSTVGTSLRTAAVRRIGDVFVLLAWWSARKSTLGGAGTSWNGEDYFALLTSAEGVERFLRGVASMGRAAALPLAECARTELPIPASIVLGCAAATSAFFIAVAAFRVRLFDVFAGAAWILPPLLLLAPGYTIGRDLESVRVIILPGAALLFAIVAGCNRLLDRSRFAAAALFFVLTCANVLLVRAAVEGYRAASVRVDALLTDTADWPEETALVLHARDDRTGVFVPDLVLHRGAYVLSSAWPTALRPPFRAAPLTVTALGDRDEPMLAARIESTEPAPRIAALVYEARGPRIVTLAPGGGERAVVLEPSNGAAQSREAPPRFIARFPAGAVEPSDDLRIVFRLPHGGEFIGVLPGAAATAAADGSREAEFTPSKIGIPADALRAVAAVSEMLVWHVRVERKGREILRSRPAILYLR